METFPVCTQCGFTLGEVRTRGLLGCPHCYISFGEALQGDLLWMHAALEVSAVTPLKIESQENHDPEKLAHYRRLLADAVRIENYTEAERVRLLIASLVASHTQRKLGDEFGLG